MYEIVEWVINYGFTLLILLEKLANAIGIYCDTQNFVAIRRFSATVRDFGCVRMTCCNQNLSVTIKILLVAIYRRYHNTYFLSLQQGGVFTTEKNVLHVRWGYCNVYWIGCYSWWCHNQNEGLLLLFSTFAIDPCYGNTKLSRCKWKHTYCDTNQVVGNGNLDIVTQTRGVAMW